MKAWHEVIHEHIEAWSARLKPLGREWWPHHVYHSTDVRNAVNILMSGCVYSRLEAEKLGLMKVDNASPTIIEQTREGHKGYARLYFRPRTPTHYRCEGIRPPDKRELDGAHCPVPVFFLFDAYAVLAAEETEFSDGNMAKTGVIYDNSRDFFLSIPFDKVFHHDWFEPESLEGDEIIFHRMAEVLVHNSLPLDPYLKCIACRSVAERQTLLHLLPADICRKWEQKITLGVHGLFERKWTYVEEVTMHGEKVTFYFNPNTQTPGTFNVVVRYHKEGATADEEIVIKGRADALRGVRSLHIRGAAERGELALFLDDALAFKGILTTRAVTA